MDMAFVGSISVKAVFGPLVHVEFRVPYVFMLVAGCVAGGALLCGCVWCRAVGTRGGTSAGGGSSVCWGGGLMDAGSVSGVAHACVLCLLAVTAGGWCAEWAVMVCSGCNMISSAISAAGVAVAWLLFEPLVPLGFRGGFESVACLWRVMGLTRSAGVICRKYAVLTSSIQHIYAPHSCNVTLGVSEIPHILHYIMLVRAVCACFG